MVKAEVKEYKYHFEDYVYSHWKTTKREVQQCLQEIWDNTDSVTEMTNVFEKYYDIAGPTEHNDIWQFLCYMKIEDMSENSEEYTDLMWKKLEGGELLPKDMQPQIEHMVEIPFEIQAAVNGIEVSEFSRFKNTFLKLCNIYPNLEELRMIQLAVCMKEKDFNSAVPILHFLEKKYPLDYELLKIRLSIYALDGSDVDLLQTVKDIYWNLRERAGTADWKLLHDGAKTLLNRKKYEEGYKMLMALAEYPGKMHVDKNAIEMLAVFCEIINLPSYVIENSIDLIQARYVMLINKLCSKGVNLNQEPLNNLVGNYVIMTSEKLDHHAFRSPFAFLLDSLEKRNILQVEGYYQIISSGYVALESYEFDDDQSFPPKIKNILQECFSKDRILTAYEKRNLTDYLDMNKAKNDYIRNNYPNLAKKVKRVVSEAKKASKKEIFPDMGTAMQPVKREDKKVGRNDPCPCGSGLKYKKCCGKNS